MEDDPISIEEKEKKAKVVSVDKAFKPYFKTKATNLVLIIKPPKFQYNQEGQRIILDSGTTVRFRAGTFVPTTTEEHDLMLEISKKKTYIKYVSSNELKKEDEKEKAIAAAVKAVEEKYKDK